MSRVSIVIPTLRRQRVLGRALDRLERQSVSSDAFEVLVVCDAAEEDMDAVRAAVGLRSYAVRVLRAKFPGASAARNRGWREARASLILFLGDDILAGRSLVEEHLRWHERHPGEEVGVLGRVRWARELRVTQFMRWLDHGIQFDYPRIDGPDAGWARFYTANASVKRRLVERAGGFDEERFPFLYEDLDLGYRMRDLGFRLLYNPRADAEHLHPVTLEQWRKRAAMIAASELRFVRKHAEVRPYFLDLFQSATTEPARRGRAARLAPIVPRRVPWLGPRVWSSVDAQYRRELAPDFLAAWRAAEAAEHAGGAQVDVS